ncbi:hypothetical protein [Pseudoxanthomonas japonensis]|uniref:hypothetical protein n=1 Tax=Pseudoxanthomonas japonensis TaxID=69284 RepID=UPI003749FA22
MLESQIPAYLAAIMPTAEELRAAIPDINSTLQKLLDEVSAAPNPDNVVNAVFALEGARRHLFLLLEQLNSDGGADVQ